MEIKSRFRETRLERLEPLERQAKQRGHPRKEPLAEGRMFDIPANLEDPFAERSERRDAWGCIPANLEDPFAERSERRDAWGCIPANLEDPFAKAEKPKHAI